MSTASVKLWLPCCLTAVLLSGLGAAPGFAQTDDRLPGPDKTGAAAGLAGQAGLIVQGLGAAITAEQLAQ